MEDGGILGQVEIVGDLSWLRSRGSGASSVRVMIISLLLAGYVILRSCSDSGPPFSLLGSGEGDIGQDQGWLLRHVTSAVTQGPTLRGVLCLV